MLSPLPCTMYTHLTGSWRTSKPHSTRKWWSFRELVASIGPFSSSSVLTYNSEAAVRPFQVVHVVVCTPVSGPCPHAFGNFHTFSILSGLYNTCTNWHTNTKISISRESDWWLLWCWLTTHSHALSLEKSRNRSRSTTWSGLTSLTVIVRVFPHWSGVVGLNHPPSIVKC